MCVCVCIYIIYTYMHAKNANHLAAAEWSLTPGQARMPVHYKQALRASAGNLLEPGLGTCRRTNYLFSASGVGTRSPTWTTADIGGIASVIMHPGNSEIPGTHLDW